MASSASLISKHSGEPNAGDDDVDSDSLEDDADVTKFNEDGSFIGIYGQDQTAEDNVTDESQLIANDVARNGTATDSIPAHNTQNSSN